MTVTARFDEAALTVDPGTTVSVGLTVHNGGDHVEAYQLQVVGEPAGWAMVQPPELHVYPGEEQQAQLVFAPPYSSAVPAGVRAFGVRVSGTDRPDDASVPEGQVEVLPFTDVAIELTPRTSHGRGRARHELAVDNRGNAPVPLALAGDDADEAVTVRVHPGEVVVGPGEAAFARVLVKPVQRRWTGPPVTRPFRVVAVASETDMHAIDGSMVQEAVLPKWLGKAVAAALVIAVLLAAGWLALLRPVVQSAAQEAVQEPVAAAQANAGQASKNAAEAQTAAGTAGKAAGQAAEGTKALGDKLVEKGLLTPEEVASPPTGGTTVVAAGTPFSRRLQLDVAAGATRPATYQVDPQQEISVTDVFFENRQGDSGTVRMLINGDVLFEKALANFRDLDEHFVTPIVLAPDATVTFETTCVKAGPDAADGLCRTALLIVGHSALRAAG